MPPSHAKAESATVLVDKGMDKCSIQFEAPSPLPMYAATGEKLCLSFNAPRGTGVAYIQEHFPGIPIREIQGTTGAVREIAN